MIANLRPHEWLKQEYLRRRAKNSSYSLRAFSRLIGLPSGRVSQLMNRRRLFTPGVGDKIASALELDSACKNVLLHAIEAERASSKRRSNPSRLKALAKNLAPTMRELKADEFDIIADPFHFSLLSLIETADFRPDPVWIGRRLGRTSVEAREALSRLERVGLVTWNKAKIALHSSAGIRTSSDVPNTKLRKAQKIVLKEAAKSLDDVAIALRDITSITAAIDVKKLPEAKELISDFRRQLVKLLECGHRSEVYRLAIQLYPVSNV